MPETELETSEPPPCAYCRMRSGEFTTAIGIVCTTCRWSYFYECRGCSVWADADNGQSAQDTGRFYCSDCFRAILWECYQCGSWVESLECDDQCEDCARCDDCGYLECECRDDDACDGLYSYDYKPCPEFHGEGRTYLGLELEVSTPWRRKSEAVQIAHEHIGSMGYLKEDGSVDGFEIVTHPMTPDYAARHFPWQMLHELAEVGCGDENAGIHVHVNRKAFDSPAHIFRWLKLIYRNEREVTAIARRESQQWAPFRRSERSNCKAQAKGDRYGNRYSAVNTCNRATFEVRVFASSLNEREVRAALDLVAASVEYTRDLTVPHILAGGWTWDGFMKWAQERPEYAALVAESQERCNV